MSFASPSSGSSSRFSQGPSQGTSAFSSGPRPTMLKNFSQEPTSTRSSTVAADPPSLICPICKTQLKNPRVLPCLHSCCLLCLQSIVGQNKRFPCPVCRQAVIVDQRSGVDGLPMNTFLNILDLGDSSEPSIENDFGNNVSPSAIGNSSPMVMDTKQPRPPLRQPFFNSTAALGSLDTGKKVTHDQIGNLPTYSSVWPTTAEKSIWTNSFDFRPSSESTAVVTTSVSDSSGWQMLDSSDAAQNEPLKSAFVNVLGATAVATSSSQSMNWSTVVGSKPGMTSSSGSTATCPPPGFAPPSKVAATCSCEDKHVVTSRCRDCNEDLCDSCVDAHQRVNLTRNHAIVRYPDTNAHSSVASAAAVVPAASSLNLMSGFSHSPVTTATTPLFGFPRDSDVFKVYTDAVEKAKADCEKLMTRARQGCLQIDEAKLLVVEQESLIEKRYATVYAEITKMTETYIGEIQTRAKELLTRLDTIHKVKLATLAQQKRELASTTICLSKVADQLASCSISGREMDLINSCNVALSTIKEVQIKCGTLAVQEDDTICVELPGPQFLKSLSSFGFIGGSPFAPNSFAEGDGLKKATLGKDARFYVSVRDQLNEPCQRVHDPIKVVALGPDGRPVKVSVSESQNGMFRVIWIPSVEGDHIISVAIKDRHITDSPFRVKVRTGRNYNSIGMPLFTIGVEGEKDGELCRPWGVCCSREGYIVVANRSNNRIEVYTSKGVFHYKFGVSGKLNGQFDRPSSVCCDSKNRLIVADKDNHRVQVFTIDGKFLLAFGEKGSKQGQFNYPWDVACNSKDQILVSDTRNHRIQLFSPNGEFLNKYGFEGAMWKHFDSPRGVAFTADDQAVVTDFNNHRLLVIRSDFQGAQFLGKEGSENGSFNRPNGVAVDEEGHIIVADSRNDRVQIFSASGVFIRQFGVKGSGPGEFDRPSGVCVSSDGLVIVVDFGNNRVQVF